MRRRDALTADDIGNRGQAIFYALMTDFAPPNQPIFRPHPLGDKFPTLDYHVELIGSKKRGRYFFAQIKATTLGYTVRERRLRISVSKTDIQRMLVFPAPTYLFGIDERQKVGFISSINEGSARAVNGLSTRFPINSANLRILWAEVDRFWEDRDMRLIGSHFR